MRSSQSLFNLTQKLNLFNDKAFNYYSIAYASYYDAEFEGMINYLNSVVDANYNRAILFVQLRLIFFVLFTFTIFAYLWRIFLNNI